MSGYPSQVMKFHVETETVTTATFSCLLSQMGCTSVYTKTCLCFGIKRKLKKASDERNEQATPSTPAILAATMMQICGECLLAYL